MSRGRRERDYSGFEGSVGTVFADSEPWWPPERRARRGAPNVVVILCDDLGYADLGCYGSEIETPHLDQTAALGVRYANFHVTAICSPTRAALLTGMNHHEAGVGYLAYYDTGFPGYRGRIADDAATAAEVFRHYGYSTFAVGKWHLTTIDGLSVASDKSGWPVQRGFERFYGFLWGFTNLHHPQLLHEDNHVVEVDAYSDGYFFTDDATERAARMIREAKATDPEKPFFLYLAHGATHAPLQAPAADIAKYRGRYEAGWDRIREARFARQLELGIAAPDTRLAPRNAEPGYAVPAWDELSPREQELFARHMEVYAGMVDNVDQNVGRLRRTLAELGELDNTIFVFASDNGASREGGSAGTTEYYRTVSRVHDGTDVVGFERDWERRELLGSPRMMNHYPWGWAQASNTPFRLYKGTTFAGGHQVPLIVSWPAGLRERGALRGQYAHVRDVLPTLLDLAGLEPLSERDGKPVRPMSGVSLVPTLADADAAPTRREQYYEIRGHRAYYRDGWEVAALHYPRTPISDDEWRLYHVEADPTQLDDLAAEEPARVRELADAFEDAAWENRVYPLEDWSERGQGLDGTGLKRVGLQASRRPRDVDPFRPVRLTPEVHTFDPEQARGIVQGRSFRVTVEVDFRPGDEGVLVAHGDQGGGYVLFVERDELVFVFNDCGSELRLAGGPLAEGACEIVLDVDAPEDGRWDLALLVDGEERGRLDRLEMFSVLVPFEGVDVGIDRRSPVCWDLYERRGPFAYTGRIASVVYTPGPYPARAPARLAAETAAAADKFD